MAMLLRNLYYKAKQFKSIFYQAIIKSLIIGINNLELRNDRDLRISINKTSLNLVLRTSESSNENFAANHLQ